MDGLYSFADWPSVEVCSDCGHAVPNSQWEFHECDDRRADRRPEWGPGGGTR